MPTFRKKPYKFPNSTVRAVFFRLFIFSLFIGTLVTVIAYARGYRPDIKTRSITSTGVIAITSYPQAAKVYINGTLKGVTNLNLTLPPGEYKVELKKEGYTEWENKVTLKGEIVMTLDGLLFPKNPSLSPLTSLGVTKAIPIGQTDKLILISKNNNLEKDGLYIFEMNKRPLSLLPPLKPLLLIKNLPKNAQIDNVKVSFSPDYQQGIFDFKTDEDYTVSYLMSLNEENIQLFDITTSKDTLLDAWKEQKNKEISKILETFPKEITKVASDSIRVVSFSPDETKMLYQVSTPLALPAAITPPLIGSNQTAEERNLQTNRLYIYDRKEDKNFAVNDLKLPSTTPPLSRDQATLSVIPTIPNLLLTGDIYNSILWYPDSRHLTIKEKENIIIIDYDGKNKRTIYSGPFDEAFFNVNNEGKLLILTNLNPQNNQSSDLYAVGIK
ncbi:MAG: PEGA domain-containing protein [Candidatus Roizmanbacteria bacterium]|nr:MAG: PEGA domain-containing protein [Candidatus Roizmanbacteria bacterium]